MIEPDLLKLLVCPESHQPVRIADESSIEQLNRRIMAGEVTNRGGKKLTTPISSGLIREDGKLLYPIRNKLPIMLIDEAIPLSA
jgi:uncharacterized protein YbaR (Trm112 family)